VVLKNIMAEQQHAEGGNIFVYTGQQVVPFGVTHVRIDKSVKIIPRRAFYERELLVSVETHDGIGKIEMSAFNGCNSLRGINLLGVKEVGYVAFNYCSALTDVEFSDKLETIEESAFNNCLSLQKIKLPSVRTIESGAFADCMQLTDVEFGDKLETIDVGAFANCPRLQRIAIPLKDNMFSLDHNMHQQRYNQFDQCGNLTTVELVGVGRIRKTISSLLLESWKAEMNQEIDRINQVLPNTSRREKTNAIRLWIRSVINRIEHYKTEHFALLKEDMTQLELALWKAKLDEKEQHSNSNVKVQAKKAKIDMVSARKERRITSGADIIIKNVLPFLQLLE
jgi:hypothetical protein